MGSQVISLTRLSEFNIAAEQVQKRHGRSRRYAWEAAGLDGDDSVARQAEVLEDTMDRR